MVDNRVDKLIFIVENDVIQLTVIEKKLKELNVTNFRSFVTAGECLQHLDEKPEILIMDYYLEQSTTAIDLMREVKKKLPETRFILMTASESPETATEAYENGAFEFIVKGEPTFYLRIKNLINRIIECEKLHTEIERLKA